MQGARLVYEALSRYLSDYALKSSVALSRRQKELAQHNLFSIGRTSMFVSESSSFDFLDLSLSCGKYLQILLQIIKVQDCK